jgi:hypothetical protein
MQPPDFPTDDLTLNPSPKGERDLNPTILEVFPLPLWRGIKGERYFGFFK